MRSNKDFLAGSSHTGAGQPQNMQAFKGTKLGPKVKQKAWIKVFVAQRSRANNHISRLRLLRENLIGDDNHEIPKTWTLFQDSDLQHSYAYRGQKGDNYDTT